MTDDAGSKGEECKEPLGGLAGLPWVVTPFPELGKAAQRAGLGHAPFEASLGRSSVAFDPHVGRAGGRNQSHLQATIRRYIVEEKFQEMQNVCRGVTHLRNHYHLGGQKRIRRDLGESCVTKRRRRSTNYSCEVNVGGAVSPRPTPSH